MRIARRKPSSVWLFSILRLILKICCFTFIEYESKILQPFIVWRLPTIDISERSLCSEALQMFSGTRNVAKKYSYALQSTNFPGSTPHIFLLFLREWNHWTWRLTFCIFIIIVSFFFVERTYIWSFGELVLFFRTSPEGDVRPVLSYFTGDEFEQRQI